MRSASVVVLGTIVVVALAGLARAVEPVSTVAVRVFQFQPDAVRCSRPDAR